MSKISMVSRNLVIILLSVVGFVFGLLLFGVLLQIVPGGDRFVEYVEDRNDAVAEQVKSPIYPPCDSYRYHVVQSIPARCLAYFMYYCREDGQECEKLNTVYPQDKK